MFGWTARGWLAIGVVGALAACTALDGLSGSPDPEPLPDRVAACAAEGAPTCGAHGTCADGDGGAYCACAERYAGPDCSSCAPGFQDDDHDGTCEPVCGSVSCTAHQVCDLTGGAPTCVCATGYAIANGACVWQGTLQDPGFQDTPPNAWTLDGGVAIDPSAPAPVSPGLARIPRSACSAGRIRQSFPMPTIAEGEPLAIDVSSQMACQPPPPTPPGFPPLVFPCFGNVYRLGFRGRFQSGMFSVNNGTTPVPVKDHICLGERAYGGTTDLEMRGECNFWVAEEAIDHATIVSAPECPLPGKVANGDFEGTGGWTATGTLAEIAATGGNGGSRAGHLLVTKLCDTGTLAGTVSVPQSTPHPALVMTVKGSQYKTMTLGLGINGTIGTLTGSNVFDKVSLCLPEWSRGLAFPLSFSATLPANGGTCGAQTDTNEWLFDDLTIASDMSCADPGWVVDGDFEVTGRWMPWSLGTGASVAQNKNAAHGGNGYLVLSAPGDGTTCNGSSASQPITVPDAKAGAGGPTLRFWYRTSAPGTPTLTISGGPGAALAPAATWTQASKCLDPNLAGQRFTASFAISGTGSCSSATMFVDDVEAGYDPACPP